MPSFSGRPSEISRFLGLCDADDPTNLPIGLAALCRNTEFQLTSAETRAGINLSIQGLNKSPITGLLGCIYEPETEQEKFFQLPLLFDMKGALQYETPVGGGATKQITGTAPIAIVSIVIAANVVTVTLASRCPYSIGDKVTLYNLTNAYFLNGVQLTVSFLPGDGVSFSAPYPKGVNPELGAISMVEVFTENPGAPLPTYNLRITQAGGTFAIGDSVTFDGLTTYPVLNGQTLRISWIDPLGRLIFPWVAPVYGPAADTGTVGTPGTNYPLTPDTGYVLVQLAPLPANSHMIGVQAYNKAWLAFSDLIQPTSRMAVLDLKTLSLDPYGLKPYGWTWTAQTSVIVGEVATPTQKGGNGHTYQCIKPGITGKNEPIWPLTTGATIVDGQAIWQEHTIVVANRLPVPTTPQIALALGGGFAAGLDVYIVVTFTNPKGQTTTSTPAFVTTDATHDSVDVPVPALADLAQWIQNLDVGFQPTAFNIYVASVAHGAAAPALATYQLFSSVALGSATVNVNAAGAGAAPPTTNTAFVVGAGNVLKDSSTGGPNNTQGYRYVSVIFINRNLTWSGFTVAATVPYEIDDSLHEIGVFNVPVGPPFIAARAIAFTAADGRSAGPFFVIGDYQPTNPPGNFVYPETDNSDGFVESSTVFGDNETTAGIFNFTDTYLAVEANSVTERLRVIWPYPAVDIYYSKTTNRMIQTGIPGFYSAHFISLAGDPESYFGDTGYLTIGADDGERCWCAREFRGTLYSLRERSGFVITPNTGDPGSWTATQRWEKVGPCGPRAVDVCGKFMLFVHRSGVYKYEETDPEPVYKEIPRWWQQINWAAAETVWVKIDEETSTVRIGVPVGASTVPNQVLLIDYKEGWQNPIHFSPYAQKEVSMDAARRYSPHDIAAFVCARIERTITGQPPFIDGPEGIAQLDPSFFASQLLFGSSGPDGGVHARTPGIWSDNGQGIDWQYETVAPQLMMALCKLEGFNLNARGNGLLYVSFLAGREMASSDQDAGKTKELKARPVDLNVEQSKGISRNVPSKINERWRMRFTNGKVAGAWASLKYACMFSIPMFSGRSESDE